jgi:hypothetical protein
MKTTVYLDSKDIGILKQKHGDNFVVGLKKVLKEKDLNNLNINIFDPVEEDKRIYLFTFTVEEWRLLNHWIINQSNELMRPKIRDALLSL